MRSKLVLVLLMGACRERQSLVDMSAFTEVDASDDPFDDRPDNAFCPAFSWSVETVDEAPVLEVDTGLCRYLLVEQPTLVPLFAGDRVDVRITHGALEAPQEATAHVAVQVPDHVLLDEEVAIPSRPGKLRASTILTQDLPQGSPILVHLHNHGANTWNVAEISGGPDID